MGFTAMQKMIALIFVTVCFSLYFYNFVDSTSTILVPFTKYKWELGPLYLPFIIFVILGTVNGVNITDGLDGLASGVTAIVSMFFIFASLLMQNLPLAIFSAMITGICLGFLIFNIHPAKVFMGDTGSLALGGAIAAIAVMLKMPLFLVIIGAIYVVEILSVMIQVTWYKKTGKRVFKMAPLHHHFELCGWKETKVVAVFWAVTAVLNIISILALL
jgi:phospho-N-acetylmuramoyl-pentapeptide-transferase